MALHRGTEPMGNPYLARGVCMDCHKEQDITVYAPAMTEVVGPIVCPLCKGEFWPGAVEIMPSTIKVSDLTGGLR